MRNKKGTFFVLNITKYHKTMYKWLNYVVTSFFKYFFKKMTTFHKLLYERSTQKSIFLVRAGHLLLLLAAVSALHHSFKEARAGSLLWIMFSKKSTGSSAHTKLVHGGSAAVHQLFYNTCREEENGATFLQLFAHYIHAGSERII